jgi:hypothetical protein
MGNSPNTPKAAIAADTQNTKKIKGVNTKHKTLTKGA